MNNTDPQLQMALNRKSLRKILNYHPSANPQTDNPARFLLCLPCENIQYHVALKVFLPVIRKYPAVTKLLVHQSLFTLVREINPDLLIPLITSQLDSQGFPTDPAVLNLLTADLVVAVDLNVSPTIPTAFIVSSSRARIKAGFQAEFSEELFNLIVTIKKDSLIETAYVRIWNLIEPEISKLG